MLRHLARDNDLTVAGFRDPELDAQEAFLDFIPQRNCHLLPEPERMRLSDFLQLGYLPRWCLSYFSLELKSLVDRLVDSGNFDQVHISHSYMAWYLLNRIDDLDCVVDHHNVKSLFFENAARSTRSWRDKIGYRAERKRWLAYEREIIPLFNEHIACSAIERALLREMTGKKVHLVPSGVDTDAFVPRAEPVTGKNLLFTGSLDYFPNDQAVTHFCENCLPSVRSAVPDVTLQVVGKNPTLRMERLLERTPNAWYSYNVRDIRPFYYQSTIFVVPLLTGAGTRLKIMEAMAAGLPVVSTRKGCEGLGLENGDGILIEDDPQAMAGLITGLLQDAKEREALGRKAIKIAHNRFSWDRILQRAQEAGTVGGRQESGRR